MSDHRKSSAKKYAGNTSADLRRMRTKVRAGAAPWTAGWKVLAGDRAHGDTTRDILNAWSATLKTGNASGVIRISSKKAGNLSDWRNWQTPVLTDGATVTTRRSRP